MYVDFDLRAVAARHGRELAAQVRDDLRHLAPDLLRWHLPRIAPDGLLRPGLTVALARYRRADAAETLQLVARTPPGWADAEQRFSLALWDPTRPCADVGLHPHPHPSRRFRLDLHRHLWDVRRSAELRVRSGADRSEQLGPDPLGPDPLGPEPLCPEPLGADSLDLHRWAAEAAILLRTDRPVGAPGRVGVRIGFRRLLVLATRHDGSPTAELSAGPADAALPLLPDAATWTPPDLALLRAGLIGPDALHPLVASALVPGHATARGRGEETPHQQVVACRGARHRIGMVGGVLAPLDHDPDELRREELLSALSGTPLPCLQAVDMAHRRPECLDEVRGRLDHGDVAGALDIVTALLGPHAVLRHGALRDELAAAARRRIDHVLYRAGLAPRAAAGTPRPARRDDPRRRALRSHPRHGMPR